MAEVSPMDIQDITRHPHYRDAFEIAMQAHRVKPMTPSEFTAYVRQTICSLTGDPVSRAGGIGPSNWPVPKDPDEWQESIETDGITCMICHKKFQLLTKAHIRKHGGTKKQYRDHFHIPPDVTLAASGLVEQRRREIEVSRIWELKDKEKKPRKRINAPKVENAVNGETLAQLFGIEEDD